ncbi:MAG: hypothetical protein ACYSYL_00025 [Planctomycetota bacterium]
MATLKADLDKIRRKFGDQIIADLKAEPEPVAVVSTGLGALDHALQCGGFPRSRITTLYGPESGGKTTLSLWALGRLIGDGGVGAYFDIEQGGSEAYLYACLENAGIPVAEALDKGQLIVVRPDTAEDAMTVAHALVPHVDLMILDSISVMLTKTEIEAEPGSVLVGVAARFQTAEFKKLSAELGTTDCALVVVSHIRARISPFGSSETTTEPNALRHLAAVRVRVAKDKGAVKEDGVAVIQPAKASVRKNKVGMPHGQIGFDIILGHGISPYRDALELGVALGTIERAGSTYRYPPGEKYKLRASGIRTAVRKITDSPELFEEIQSANAAVLSPET